MPRAKAGNMENPHTHAISYLRLVSFYGRFFPAGRLLKAAFELALKGSTSFPLTIDVLITGRCNLACEMCSFRPSGADEGRSGNELKLGEVEEFVRQVREHKPLIHIGGGEPFLRGDILDVIGAVKRARLKCLITTNGLLLDENIGEKAVSLGLDGIIFSFYGWGDIHDKITGDKGSFDKAAANLRSLLKRRGRTTGVFASTVPLPGNVRALKDLVGRLRHMGVDGVKIEHLNFLTAEERGTAPAGRSRSDLDPCTFVRDGYFDRGFVADLLEARREISSAFGRFAMFKPYMDERQTGNWYMGRGRRNDRCFFMTHSALVNYNGDILPCQFFQKCVLGNIKKDALKDVWTSAAYRELRKAMREDHQPVCDRCCKN